MTPHLRTLAAALLVTLLTACAPSGVDRSAAALEEVLQADRDFAALAAAESASHAFRHYLAGSAVLLPDGGTPLSGDALAAAVDAMDYGLEWAPEGGWAAASGELGATWGYWTSRSRGEDGTPVVHHGKYSNVWKRGPDGSWRVVMDMGNRGPQPERR